jgi:hypothetical protein
VDKNSYVILGISFGASRAEANTAFARKAEALKREGGSLDQMTDLTWASSGSAWRYVTDQDAAAIKDLVARLRTAQPQDEDACRTMLEHELRKHAYLL